MPTAPVVSGVLVHTKTGGYAVLKDEPIALMSKRAHTALTKALAHPPQGFSDADLKRVRAVLQHVAALPRQEVWRPSVREQGVFEADASAGFAFPGQPAVTTAGKALGSRTAGRRSGWGRTDGADRPDFTGYASCFVITALKGAVAQPHKAFWGAIEPDGAWGWSVGAAVASDWALLHAFAAAARLAAHLAAPARLRSVAAWHNDWRAGVWTPQAHLPADDLVEATAYAICGRDDADPTSDTHMSDGYLSKNSDLGASLSAAQLFDTPQNAYRTLKARHLKNATVVEVAVRLRKVALLPAPAGRPGRAGARDAQPVRSARLQEALAAVARADLTPAKDDSDTEMLRRRCNALEQRLARYEDAVPPADAPSAPIPRTGAARRCL